MADDGLTEAQRRRRREIDSLQKELDEEKARIKQKRHREIEELKLQVQRIKAEKAEKEKLERDERRRKREEEALNMRLEVEKMRLRQIFETEKRRQQMEAIQGEIEVEMESQLREEIERRKRSLQVEEAKKELENLLEIAEKKKQLRECCRQVRKQRKLQELDQQMQQLQLEREKLRARRELGEAARQSSLDKKELSQLARMEKLRRLIEQLEIRKADEENIDLDRTIVDWSVAFPVVLKLKKYKVKTTSDLLSHISASSFESIDFLEFTEEAVVLSGTLKPRPFDKGTFRYAYYAQLKHKPHVIKHMIDIYHELEEELSDLKGSVAVHFIGIFVVAKFNKMKHKMKTMPRFEMLPCDLVEWENRPATLTEGGKPARQFWCLEPLLPDEFEFTKYSNNGDFQDPNFPAAHALSHFSYELFKGRMMMVDIQGCFSSARNQFILTDPAFHTDTGFGFGGTNLGENGFKRFFKKHVCSDYCRALGLSKVTV